MDTLGAANTPRAKRAHFIFSCVATPSHRAVGAMASFGRLARADSVSIANGTRKPSSRRPPPLLPTTPSRSAGLIGGWSSGMCAGSNDAGLGAGSEGLSAEPADLCTGSTGLGAGSGGLSARSLAAAEAPRRATRARSSRASRRTATVGAQGSKGSGRSGSGGGRCGSKEA